MSGKPISLASAKALCGVTACAEPGTVGTPALRIAVIAETLLPIKRICSGRGPMKMKPELSTISANSAFSARKP